MTARGGGISKYIKSSFAFLGVVVFLLAIIELFSFTIIRYHYHIDPLASEQEIYSRTISGYYISRNSANFSLSTFDGLHHFKPTTTIIDTNGFITDTLINKIKPANTIRIFLTGGSAAFGFIQNQNVVRDRSYPSGTYDYPSSISGLLKAKLQRQLPGKKFEVINAAVPLHYFHQGYLQYLSLLHDFSPDIIINMDGNNDEGSIITGQPFDVAEHPELEDMIALKAKRPASWPFTLFLIKYYKDRNYRNNQTEPAIANVDFTERDYDTVQSLLILKSQTLIWLIASYEQQLKQDNVHSIFVLQPMLRRLATQKNLSLLEKKLLDDSQKNSLIDVNDPEIHKKIEERGVSSYLHPLGTKMDALSNIMFAYYFDRYFSAHVDSIVRSYGNDYIDLNKEIVTLSDTTEFFVDYCHLTPFGNEFVAQKISDQVVMFINGGK